VSTTEANHTAPPDPRLVAIALRIARLIAGIARHGVGAHALRECISIVQDLEALQAEAGESAPPLIEEREEE